MRLRNTTSKQISCIGCKYYNYGLCKRTHEYEPIKAKKMYPLASSYRKICGYKNPKYYTSIHKYLINDINIGEKVIKSTLLFTPISITSMLIGLNYDCNIMFISSFVSSLISGTFLLSSIDKIRLDKKRLHILKKIKKW